MKKFIFRLESCLRLRRHREELEEIRLSDLLREELQLSEKKHELQAGLIRARREMSEQRDFAAGEISLYTKYIMSVERKTRDLEVELQRLGARISIQRSILLKARKSRRVVELLKGKRKRRHDHESERQIQSELEELHLMRRGRETSNC